jgi:predicted ATPase
VRYLDLPDGESRFGMLETIRAYGLELLAASGEEEAIRRRHADCFLALAEAIEPEILGPNVNRYGCAWTQSLIIYGPRPGVKPLPS